MRRLMRAATMAVVVALVVAGCGTTGGGGDGAGAARFTTPGELRAAFEDAGATCQEPAPFEPDEGEFDLGMNPTEELECEFEGLELGALFFASQADRTAALAIAIAFICGFGAPGFPHLASGPWFAGLEGDLDDEEASAASLEVLGGLAEELDLEVLGEECPEGSGPDWEAGDPGEDDEEPTRTGPGSSKDEALPLGESAEIGDYTVTITEVDPDGLDAVLAANDFNEPPTNDRYVVFTIEATYQGDEEGNPGIDLDAVLSGGDSVQYQSSDCMATLDSAFGVTLENGGSVTITDCFDVPLEAIDGGAIFIESFFGFGDDADRTYWALS